MAYKLVITEHADELFDALIYHLIFRLKNEQAASHLLDEIEHIYIRLEDNPYQFPNSRDAWLSGKGYYEAVLSGMNYVVVFSVAGEEVYVAGIFHQLEDYRRKL